MSARHSRRSSRARRWVNGGLLALLAGLVVIGALSLLTGSYQARPVLSGSMRPGLPVGGVVITHRVPVESLQVRDVVVFHRPDHPDELVVHRIISLTRGPGGPVVRTQGDANPDPDPWEVTLQGRTAYRAVLSLPLVGYAAVWAHSPTGRATFALAGLLLVLVAVIGVVAQRYRPSRVAATGQPRSGVAGTSAPARSDSREQSPSEAAASPLR